MPTYFYTAITAFGGKESGVEDAQDERQLARILQGKWLLLTTAKTKQAKKRLFSFSSLLNKARPISLCDKLLFCRNLQVMVAAGIPLPRSLDILSAQAGNENFREVLGDVKQKVVEGKSLSEAMLVHPLVFSELFTNMIKVGEESGTLEQVLDQLTLQLERLHDLRSKVVGALMYPAVVIVAMIGVGTLMLILVVPKLADTFKELGVPLPVATRIVIGVGTFLATRWYIAFPVLFGILIALFRFIKTKSGRRMLHRFLLKTPVFGNIIRKTNP